MFKLAIPRNARVCCRNLSAAFSASDFILVDKGFTIFDKLPQGASLNIPPFLKEKTRLTKQEADLCLKIGKARIHVERANERIKNLIFSMIFQQKLRPFSTKIFPVCCYLVNMQASLLKEIADKYN